MTITFSINFKTQPGQTVFICGSIPELGGGIASKAEAMSYSDNGNWIKEIKIVNKQERINTYSYFVKNGDNTFIYEVGEPRYLAANGSSRKIVLYDQWQGNTPDAPFLSAPFSDIFYAHSEAIPTRTHIHQKELIVKVTVPLVEKDATICLCGNCDALGNWDPSKSVVMQPSYGSRWECHLNCEVLPQNIEYKFVKKYGDNYYLWETCNNREINVPSLLPHETLSLELSAASFQIGKPKFAGTAVPIFSLRSEKGYGIGDFSDIKLLTDWAVQTKQRIIQILPINDTTSTGTWVDSYPYSGISIMALHPIYINLREAGEINDSVQAAEFEKERIALNKLPQIDYERVLSLKTRYLHKLFEQNSEDTFAEPAYFTFFKKNKSWLLQYAAFCTLRDKFGTADFSKWGKFSTYNDTFIEKMWRAKESGNAMKYYVYVQYLLHIQLVRARNYAHSQGIAIKGDIPIGITPQSVDAWVEPYYFNMDAQAGAPPDDFSVKGQNWGFPTYNWDRMAQDGYVWWKKRFSKMAEYFDAYRIDHVLGFFRIWEIPSNQVLGLMGHFNPSLPYSYEEMKDRGFEFKYYRHATPFIRYYMLKEMFGEKSGYVQDNFLDSNELDVFTLKEEFNTQKKIETYFSQKKHSEEMESIKDGLMALVAEVLFLEDPKIQGRFHPRISAQYTYSYKALSEREQSAFNRLYDEFYYTRHNEYWKEQAINKLPELISATNMLTCAEDLGMIPDCVPQVLKSLRVLTLEIQRMPKDPKAVMGNPAEYPYLCVCTTGTHDTSTLRGWWEETHNEDCPIEKCGEIIKEHLYSPAMLAILPIQDWFSLEQSLRCSSPSDERINIPSNPKHYWRFRMSISLEHLLKMKDYNKSLSRLICESNRNKH